MGSSRGSQPWAWADGLQGLMDADHIFMHYRALPSACAAGGCSGCMEGSPDSAQRKGLEHLCQLHPVLTFVPLSVCTLVHVFVQTGLFSSL